MASPPLFQVEDQTDEDFFDKLVNDDDDGAGIHSPSNTKGMTRAVSNLSLGDVDDSVSALIADGQKNEKPVESSETSMNAASVAEVHSGVFSKEESGGSKGTSVKEVQWSIFSADSQQFGQGGFDSDMFLESDGNLVDSQAVLEPKSTFVGNEAEILNSSVDSYEQHGAQFYSSVNEQGANSTEVQDWENLYPGWKYDPSSGQWYQLDGYDVTTNTHTISDNYSLAKTNSHELAEALNSYEGGEAKVQNASVSERSDALYHQQSYHSALQTIVEESSLPSSWNQVSQGIVDYPSNMVFDPQYPEWYYDTITQQWYTLESYKQALSNSFSDAQAQYPANVNFSAGLLIKESHVSSGVLAVPEQSSQESHWNASLSGFGQQSILQEQKSQESQSNVSSSLYDPQSLEHEHNIHESPSETSWSGYNQHRMWQPESPAKSGNVTSLSNNQLNGSFYGSMEQPGIQTVNRFGSNTLGPILNYNYSSNISMTTSHGYLPSESTYHSFQPNMKQTLEAHLSDSNYGTDSNINYAQAAFQGANQSYSHPSYNMNEQRSSAGRPPHALVAFGFGGKIVVMKDVGSSSSSFVSGSQGNVGGVILVDSLVDVVMPKMDTVDIAAGGGFGYFPTLCQQSFPGPLVGGNAATKDVNKWIDDRIMNSKSSSMDFQNGELLRLLLSLLKILFQHYGKLRSPYGVDSIEGSDGPESSVSKLFASSKRDDDSFGGFGSSAHCMKNLPSEGQIRAAAIAVQNLLVSGKRKEALQCAQNGQLWGPALVLSAQLGGQFYVDTVKQMAHQQFVCGSPLRTLCLLIAGQPADVFSADSTSSGLSSSVHGPYQSSEVLPNSMFDDWQENLAIITSNRTKDDELVIIHLGDCLWKERGEVIAAHTCYLVAEANIESYSDSARLCLIGADHWKNPRTYSCPDAIQRTEIYEYSKVIGNSQFVLLPFQPYKLIYAYMLAEVGKVSDSLRYCQASMKLLKNSGRSPEVEMWRTQFSLLEERLRTHQQGGYGTNLATTKLVGKLINSIDRSIHRMIGAPPLPPMPQNSGDNKDDYSIMPKVSSSQSTMAIMSLMPSGSVESMSEWTGDSNRKVIHNRSVSEPDFGRSPKKNSAKDGSSRWQSGGSSRLGHFGSQILQKTIGLVSWTRQDRQAKLGESNKFYFDEKLKRWVEEGAELPAAEAALPPPPTSASFSNGTLDYDINNALKSNGLASTPVLETKLNPPSEQGSGIPPIPPSQNQFSAHGRMGVRSRYVDTFNKGGGSFTSSFQSPSATSVKPLAGAKFFVPAAPVSYESLTNDANKETSPDAMITEEPSTSSVKESIFSPPPAPSSSSISRFPSMENISMSRSLQSNNGGSLSNARAASWSGTYMDASISKGSSMVRSFRGSSMPSTFSPPYNDDLSHIQSSSNSHGSNSESDDLHEVKL